MKVCFLVGSFLVPFQGGSTSAYTVKERKQQTHLTLKSIRERAPGSTIIFVEGSDALLDEKFDYDILVRPTQDPAAKDLIYKNQKSIGECVMMIYTGKHVMLKDYDLVFKISGRYTLTEDFSLDNFSRTKLSFYDHIQWGYETTLYSFPGFLKDVWIDALKNSAAFMAHNNIDSIERSLRSILNVKHVHGLEKLGIEGYNAPMKRYIRY